MASGRTHFAGVETGYSEKIMLQSPRAQLGPTRGDPHFLAVSKASALQDSRPPPPLIRVTASKRSDSTKRAANLTVP